MKQEENTFIVVLKGRTDVVRIRAAEFKYTNEGVVFLGDHPSIKAFFNYNEIRWVVEENSADFNPQTKAP